MQIISKTIDFSKKKQASRPAKPNIYGANILVEISGFEPPTSCVRSRRSPTELYPHNVSTTMKCIIIE